AARDDRVRQQRVEDELPDGAAAQQEALDHRVLARQLAEPALAAVELRARVAIALAERGDVPERPRLRVEPRLELVEPEDRHVGRKAERAEPCRDAGDAAGEVVGADGEGRPQRAKTEEPERPRGRTIRAVDGDPAAAPGTDALLDRPPADDLPVHRRRRGAEPVPPALRPLDESRGE